MSKPTKGPGSGKYYRFHHDFESFSRVDLLKCGSDKYAQHHSTEVLMLAWAIDDGPIKQWVPSEDGWDLPQEVQDAIDDPYAIFFAWNKPFEYGIWKHKLNVEIPHKRWRDPMILAYSLSLPGSLAKASDVLGIGEDKKKIAAGKSLMRTFSMPRKPTKLKTYRRTLPHHEPEKWELYKEYNRQDVEAERANWIKMRGYNMPPHEWDLWVLDQEINNKGIPINMDMVDNAVEVYDETKAKYIDALQLATGLDNPNSPKQLLPWLQEHGYPFDDLKKGHVKRARDRAQEELDGGKINNREERELLIDALDLRLESSQSSASKFQALQRAVDRKDGVLRHALQFAGAGRTWRWAGRIFQVQNLPRPAKYLEKYMAQLAHDLQHLDARSIELLYDKPMEAIKSGVRPAARAPDGYMFIDADLNAIENRVLGWMTGCRKILEVFENDQDPYISFSTYLFGGSYEDRWAEYKAGDSSNRTISKPGVLGCFGTDTPVLTDKGWKRIVDVSHADMIFDGDNFVSHGGVAYRGHKSCIEKAGVWATPDHEILTDQGWETWEVEPQGFYAALDLADGKFRATSVRAGRQGLDTSAFVTVVGSELSPDQICCGKSPLDVPLVLSTTLGEARWRKQSASSFSTSSLIVSTLRAQGARTRKTPLISIMGVGEFVCGSGAPTSGLNTSSPRSETPENLNWIESTTTATTRRETCDWRLDQCKTETRETWDILNVGPNSRYVVLTEDGPVVVSNCGYMLSKGEVKIDYKTGEEEATGLLGYAWNMGITDFTAEQSALSVDTFRREFKEVKSYWYDIEKAAKKCIKSGQPVEFGVLTFDLKGPFLRMRLPSGRHLHYCRPRIEQVMAPWGKMKESITYEGIVKGQWRRQSTHPGKLTENADQAISRDLLAHGMLLADKEGIDMRLHVHDQILGLVKEDDAEDALQCLIACMGVTPDWAKGLPLKADGFISPFFTKD